MEETRVQNAGDEAGPKPEVFGRVPNIYDAVTRFPSARYIFAWTALICCALFASRLLGPECLMDDDQQRPTAYVMDVLRNGNWLVQRDQSGDVMSKPPLSTWFTAAIAAPFDRVNYFLLFLPCALAALATAWLIVGYGNRHFGRGAALFGATLYLLSMIGFKQVALVRTDSLFTVTVFLGAVLAYRAWTRQSGWFLFWLVAAASSLVKGPLGPLLSAGGLVAYLWEARSGAPRRALRGSQLGGVALYLILALGWFLLAWHEAGRALLDKQIGRELVGHAMRSDRGKLPLIEFYVPTLFFLTRFAPWSILSLLGFWRVWRRPALLDDERRFERFLFCYFFFGLVLFSLFPHHRADHLWPLIPAAALLGGREIALWWRHRSRTWLYALLGGVLAVFLIVSNIYLQRVRTRDPKILETGRVRDLAAMLRGQVGGDFPLMHVDSPYGLQFYLNTMRLNVPLARAARALSGPEAAFAVVANPALLRPLLPAGAPLHELVQWPLGKTSKLFIVSNHPRLEYTPRLATVVGPVLIRMDGLHLARTGRDALTFWARQPRIALTLVNQTTLTQKIHLRIENLAHPYDRTIRLAAGATWNETDGKTRGTDEPLRIGQLADCRGAFAQLAALGRGRAFAGLDFLVVNGDFANDADWHYEVFQRQARRLGVPVYPVLGDHDLVAASRYPAESFLNRFGYRDYAFDHGPGRFVLLDSARGELGPGQLKFLEGALQAGRRLPDRLIFQHVPPQELGDPQAASRFLAATVRGKTSKIFSSHLGGLKTTDTRTSQGTVRGVTSSSAREQQGQQETRPHWLEIKIAGVKIEEIAHDLPEPSFLARVAAHVWFKDIPMLIRVVPRIAVFTIIFMLFWIAGWRGLHHARITRR